jgi:hypothetical protein
MGALEIPAMRNLWIPAMPCHGTRAMLLLLAISQAQAASAGFTAWFESRTRALMDAVTSGEKQVWDQTLDADCIITTEDGEFLDKTKMLAGLRPLPPGFSGQIKVRGLTVRDLGAAAVVHYWLDETENIFGQTLRTTYIQTDTYRRVEDSWKVVAMQVTVVPRDLEAITVDSSGFAALVGDYSFSEAAGSRYRVFLRDGVLYGGSDPRSATQLIPLAPLVFFQKGSIHVMVFVRDKSGAINEVRELHKYNEVSMKRIVARGS